MSLREQKKQQARTDILTAAGDLIGRLGYEQAKMRDIARAANISYQTLYNYFPTKALILQELLLGEVNETAANIATLIDTYDGDLLATLHAINELRIDAVCHHDRELWREVMVELFNQRQEATNIAQLIDSAAHEAFGLFLNTVKARGELDQNVDAKLLAHMLFALSEQAFMQYVLMPSATRKSLTEVLRTQTELLVAPYLTEG